MADGNAAIWGAARTVGLRPARRCWNHKMRNVLDRLPQREQSEAKELRGSCLCLDTGRGAQSSSGVRQTLWAVVPESCDGAHDWDRMVTFSTSLKPTGSIYGRRWWKARSLRYGPHVGSKTI